MSPEDLLASPDFFVCNGGPRPCRMSIAACAARRAKAFKLKNTPGTQYHEYEMCVKCKTPGKKEKIAVVKKKPPVPKDAAKKESPPEMKKCSYCGKELPATAEYFPTVKATGQIRNPCRECRMEQNRIYRRQLQNQEYLISSLVRKQSKIILEAITTALQDAIKAAFAQGVQVGQVEISQRMAKAINTLQVPDIMTEEGDQT